MKRCAITLLCAAAAGAQAQDHADLDKTQIIGNRELPKVLYIVPWKKPLPGLLSGRPVQSVLDEALAPVDREVFRREVAYGAQVQAQQLIQAQARASPKVDPPADAAPAAPPAKPGERR